jgi:hypothetical protein
MTALQNLANYFHANIATMMQDMGLPFDESHKVEVTTFGLSYAPHGWTIVMTEDEAKSALESGRIYQAYWDQFTCNHQPYRVLNGVVTNMATLLFVGNTGCCVRGCDQLVSELLALGDGIYWRAAMDDF